MLLRMRWPEAAKWTSWIALTLGCLALLVVILTTGFLRMKMGQKNTSEAACSDFGLRNNPNITHISDGELLWRIILEKLPGVQKWASWFAAGMTGMAIIAFVIVITILVRDRENGLGRKPSPDADYAKNEVNKSPQVDYDKRKVQISYIDYKEFTPKLSGIKPKNSLRKLWAAYAALGLLCTALIGVILLNYFLGETGREIQPPCISFDRESQEIKDSYFGNSIELRKDSYFGNSIELRNRTVLLPQRLLLISRAEWLAAPPKSKRALKHPVEYVVVSHTSRESCSSRLECFKAIRRLQKSDMYEGWWDIVYNFLVAGDDRVYEGRGWDIAGAHTGRYKNGSLGISFVGMFMHQLPPRYQVKAFKELIEEGIRLKKISPDYKLVIDKKTIGSLLHKEIQTWDHWFIE